MKASFFSRVSADLKFNQRTFDKGESVFAQGQPVLNMYYIETGRVKLLRDTAEGTPVVMHVAFSGEVIAEASLFANTYHCVAVADSKTKICYVNKADLFNILEQDLVAMKTLLALYAHQIIELRILNEIKNIRSAKERVLAFLRHEMDADKKVKLTMALKDIAYRLGLSHEAFYRTLKSLEKTQQIKRTEQLITVL